jgi:hypothetical protein
MGHSRGTVTTRYIHTVDSLLVMAADTVAGYIHGLLDGKKFRRTTYALDRASREAALARLLEQSLFVEGNVASQRRRQCGQPTDSRIVARGMTFQGGARFGPGRVWTSRTTTAASRRETRFEPLWAQRQVC